MKFGDVAITRKQTTPAVGANVVKGFNFIGAGAHDND